MTFVQNLRISKAKNCLKDAEVLFENKRYNACISRCYYALFHAASAFLEEIHIPFEKRAHRFVIGAFTRECVHRRKLLQKQVTTFLEDLFNRRLAADYSLREFSEKETKRAFDKTKEILNTMIEAFGEKE